MQVTLEIKGGKALSILDVLRSMKGVKVTSVAAEKESKEAYLLDLKGAVEEIASAKAGDIAMKSFDQLLDEI
jgi:hypothetical protein